jgi:hypothetical protein
MLYSAELTFKVRAVTESDFLFPLQLRRRAHDRERRCNLMLISVGGLKCFSASFRPSVMVARNNPRAVVDVMPCISLQKLSQARISLKYISALSGDLFVHHIYYLHSLLDRSYNGHCIYYCVSVITHEVLINNWMY